MRTPFSQLEWRGKPVTELTRDELLELTEALHATVWESAENFERLLAQKFPQHAVAGHA